jgi:hypothetical protein
MGLPMRSVDKASAQVVSPRMNIVGLDWSGLDWSGLDWTGLAAHVLLFFSVHAGPALVPTFFFNNILTRLSLSTTLYKGRLTKL